MELAHTVCQFCQKTPFKYTCPKCNALYCCYNCYRKPEHKKCTSSFYNIFDQSSSFSQEDRNDVMRRYMALKNTLEEQFDSKQKERAESESSVDSDSIWTNDDFKPRAFGSDDSDSYDDDSDSYDDDSYSYDDNSDEDGDESNDNAEQHNNNYDFNNAEVD